MFDWYQCKINTVIIRTKNINTHIIFLKSEVILWVCKDIFQGDNGRNLLLACLTFGLS